MSDTDSSSTLQTTLTWGQKFGKLFLIAVNVLFLIFGCVLCAVGSYALNNQIAKLIGQTLPQGIIVVGSFLLVLSLVGGISAWKEFRIGLGIFFFFVTIMTVILFAVGIALYVKRNSIGDLITSYWIAVWNDWQNTGNNPGSLIALEIAYSCCGLYGNATLASGSSSNYAINTLPPCNGYDSNGNVIPAGTMFDGCLSILTNSVKSNFSTAGGCAIAFSIIMVIGLAATAYLMVGIRESAVNQAIEKNRARNERDMAKRRKGKGLKIPQIGADVL